MPIYRYQLLHLLSWSSSTTSSTSWSTSSRPSSTSSRSWKTKSMVVTQACLFKIKFSFLFGTCWYFLVLFGSVYFLSVHFVFTFCNAFAFFVQIVVFPGAIFASCMTLRFGWSIRHKEWWSRGKVLRLLNFQFSIKTRRRRFLQTAQKMNNRMYLQTQIEIIGWDLFIYLLDYLFVQNTFIVMKMLIRCLYIVSDLSGDYSSWLQFRQNRTPK